jgi:hypothetical protein
LAAIAPAGVARDTQTKIDGQAEQGTARRRAEEVSEANDFRFVWTNTKFQISILKFGIEFGILETKAKFDTCKFRKLLNLNRYSHPMDPIEFATITDVLATAKNIAVVGLSSNPYRASFGVSETLQEAGYRVIPVNPNEKEVLGQKAYARLEDVPEKIDIVDIFRRSEHVSEIVDSAIRVGARAIWMQEGVEDEASAERARRAGIFVVMDRCIAKDIYMRRRK